MLDFRKPLPGEKKHPDEGGFQEKCHQAFNRQRRTEDVSNVMRVIGPIGAELELHGDAGGNTHGEIDAKQHAPELHHVAPYRLARHHIDGFHDAQQNGEPQGQGNEDEVIKGGDRELKPGQLDDIHSGS